ncbi:uncharacterized protein [Aquarana catesbeiana]|uniref:uncharacterized protein isoform X3 n=1 Tax=Aquarana catesbeiana TaxID=8400 RepID=UPI003CCA2018
MSSNYSIKKSSLFQVFVWPVHCIHSLYVWMKCIISGLMDSEKIEPKNITYEECKKTSVKGEASARREMESTDTVDFPVNDSVLQALEGVSGAIYTKCFSNWYCPPEEMKDQPLFKEINAGIRDIYYNIKATVRPLEEYEILIAIANALITHLKNFRKKRMTYRYNTAQEEVDFLRKQTKCLLLYWLPDSLRNSDHILVFLNEILSINVLRPSINHLADSTFINETIVRTLDSEEVPVKDALNESCAFSENYSNIPVNTSDTIPQRKEKKKGFKGKIKAIGYHLKRNKSEACSTFRSSFPSTGEDTMDSTEEDTMDSTGGCTYTEPCESDYLSLIIDAVLQKWLQENWTVKICESPTKDRNTYKICVSEEGSLNANLWIIERSVEDFRQIYSIICREYQDLKIFTTLKEIEEAEIKEDSQFFQAIGINPDTFIDKLLELIKLNKSEPILFFSPFNYEKGTELLSRAFSDNDLSPEDNLAVKSETEDIFHESTDDESDGFKAFLLKKKKAKNKKSKDGSGNELEDTSAHNASAILGSSEDHALPTLEREDTVHHNTDRKKPGFNKVTQGDSTKSSTDPLSVPTDETSTNYLKVYTSKAVPYLEEEKNTQREKLEEEFLDALYCLAAELFPECFRQSEALIYWKIYLGMEPKSKPNLLRTSGKCQSTTQMPLSLVHQ